MGRPRAYRTVFLAMCTAALAGCSHTYSAGNALRVGVGLTEYRVMPQSVSVREGFLTLVVHNYGRLAHNLVVTQGKVFIAATKALRPGQTARLRLLLVPGTYSMTSTLLSDQTLGLYGTLTVTS